MIRMSATVCQTTFAPLEGVHIHVGSMRRRNDEKVSDMLTESIVEPEPSLPEPDEMRTKVHYVVI